MRKTMLCVVLFALAVMPVLLRGQIATGTISGTISDESGAVIPNAAISIRNQATSATRTLTANAEGLYSAPALQVGDYEVRIEMQGFRTEVRAARVLAGTAKENISA
ncbi:MAG TPA: carboxypeptidase-like regulatory domain-containing protein [Chthoniobacterales bacterium]